MTEQNRVHVTVEGIEGECRLHTIGERFEIADTTPSGLCVYAFYSLFPYIEAVRYGGDLAMMSQAFPDGKLACPSCWGPHNRAVFAVSKE